MSVISDYAAANKVYFQQSDVAHGRVATAVTGLAGDVKTLADKIAELQASAGAVTPEDQILLDELTALSKAAAEKSEAVATALEQLDALTPPAAPPA